jgi:hypothetical protein
VAFVLTVLCNPMLTRAVISTCLFLSYESDNDHLYIFQGPQRSILTYARCLFSVLSVATCSSCLALAKNSSARTQNESSPSQTEMDS